MQFFLGFHDILPSEILCGKHLSSTVSKHFVYGDWQIIDMEMNNRLSAIFSMPY